jgi:hypothetical protein
MREANEELSEFNTFSDEQHERLAARFAEHVETLHSVHGKLQSIFQRVRTLRGRLIERYPHLAETLREMEAKREAELERRR